MWAILTGDGSKFGNKWDEREFFLTGESEIRGVMDEIACLTGERRFVSAMDFGCGIGRVSRALAHFCDRVTGVDIAPSMIERARVLDADGRCEFLVNEKNDLRDFAGRRFDLIYSSIVLQHVPRATYRKYVREFRKALRGDGMLVFQMPDRRPINVRNVMEATLSVALPIAPRWLIDFYRKRKYDGIDGAFVRRLPRVLMRTNGYAPVSVMKLLSQSGFRLLAMRRLEDAGLGWANFRYFAVKNA